MGRLYCKLEADNTLGQLLLPLLADLLTSSNSSSVSTRSNLTSLASLALPLQGVAGGAGAAAGGGGGGYAAGDYGVAAGAAGGNALPSEVAGAVVCALEGMSSVCVQRGRDQWLYEQALQLLLTMYRTPSPVRKRERLTRMLLCGSHHCSGTHSLPDLRVALAAAFPASQVFYPPTYLQPPVCLLPAPCCCCSNLASHS